VRWSSAMPSATVMSKTSCANKVSPSIIRPMFRWGQCYGPELEQRCRLHLQSTNDSYRIMVMTETPYPLLSLSPLTRMCSRRSACITPEPSRSHAHQDGHLAKRTPAPA
jgi:hypothetical protein